VSTAACSLSPTFPKCKLRKSHAQELIRTGKRTHPEVAIVAANEQAELVVGQKAHDLGKYGLALIHVKPSWVLDAGPGGFQPNQANFKSLPR